jgi:hypothetical protein
LIEYAHIDKLSLTSDYLTSHKDVPEIPRSQRYAARPALETMFTDHILKDKAEWNRVIREAVEQYRCTQRAVADPQGMHFTYASRVLNERQETAIL